MYDTFPIKHQCHFFDFGRKHHGRDRMVVGFTMTNAISTYHKYHQFDSSSWCEVNLIQHYVIKYVSDLRQVSGYLRVLKNSSTNKTDSHDITEIL